ncbi:MAG: hypothetical protein ACNI25_13615 [Halarcobacter sp.]
MVDSKIIEAFHLMWGNFPEPVTLVHKNKEVIAVNALSEVLGIVKGMNYSTLSTNEEYRGCLANRALHLQQVAYKNAEYTEKEIISYWFPIEGYPELFIHFEWM